MILLILLQRKLYKDHFPRTYGEPCGIYERKKNENGFRRRHDFNVNTLIICLCVYAII